MPVTGVPAAAAGVASETVLATMIAATGAGGFAAAAGAVDAALPPALVALASVRSSPASFADFLFAGTGESGVVEALCTFAAAAAATSVAAAVTAAAAAGAGDVAAGGAGDEADRAAPGAAVAAVAGSALSSLDESCCATVVAFGVTAAFGLATEVALAVAALCFMPVMALVDEFAALGAPVAWLEPRSELLLFPDGPLVGADVCCAACDGLAGGFAAEFAAGFAAIWGGLADADVLASTKAANGCETVSWLGADACIRDGDESETTAGKSDAILGILDTLGPLEAT
jgi:hypothetical protein